MGAGVSVDNSKTISDTINETTRKFVAKTNLDCANDVKQIQEFEVRESADVDIGGDLIVDQKAALVNSCAQQVTNKQEMFGEIANAVAQKVDQEKGTDKLFQLVGVTNAEQTTNIKNKLTDEYKSISGVKCDASLAQVQKVVLEGKVKVGGTAKFSQDAKLSADCQQVADLARKVTDKITTEVEQTTIQKVPGGWATIIVSVVILVVILGIVGYFVSQRGISSAQQARQRALQQQQMMMQQAAAMQQQQAMPPQPAFQQPLPPTFMTVGATPGSFQIPQPNPQAVSTPYQPPVTGFASF